MKKRDSMSSEIRAGMKQVIREQGFGYWFREVFWYHYGKLSIALLAAFVIALLLLIESLGKEVPDFNMVLATGEEIPYLYTTELEQIVATAVGDVDGDGKVDINLQVIWLDGEDAQNRLQVAFAQPEYTLYLMDEQYSGIYCGREYFDPAANYGFTPDTEQPLRVDINDAPVIRRLNEYCHGRLTLYASICDWTTSGKGSQTWTDAAVRALNAILTAE